MKTLVIGCDASGKSTLIEGIHAHYGDTVIGSSGSPEALAFKAAHAYDMVDGDMVTMRESFYMQLEATQQPRTAAIAGNTITTNATLITRLSHSVMRSCINEPYMHDEAIIEQWLADEHRFGIPPTDAVVLTRAEPSVIRERMIARQQAGMRYEHFWAFNAPFFLERYQERWEGLLSRLQAIGIACLRLDTSSTPPDKVLEQYCSFRQIM